MSDIFGPADAPNAVTTRPSDSRVFGLNDSWFKNCSSPDLDDGTDIEAEWLNQIIAQLRSLLRGNGNAGGSPVVTESNADDALLLKSVQHLIQRGQPSYAVDSGTANNIAVTLAPTPPELKAGLIVRVKMAATNTGPTTATVNGIPKSVKLNGAALTGGELLAGHVVEMISDGPDLHIIGGESPDAVVRAALFPYLRAARAANFTSSAGVVTGVTGYGTPTGDPNVIAGFNPANSTFTCPAGLDGLWFVQGYLNTVASGSIPTNAYGSRLYKGPQIVSANSSPGGSIVHCQVSAFVSLAAGESVQFTTLANDNGIGISDFIFTAIRFGRTS